MGFFSWSANTVGSGGGGAGEANTASNVGSGTGVFKEKSGVNLELKSFSSVGNIAINSDANGVFIADGAMTGLTEGGVISVTGGDPTKFDLSAGKGIVVNNADPDNPVVTEVTWSALVAQTITNIATQESTAIGVNSSGTVVQFVSQTAESEADTQRANIMLGGIAHADMANITGITNQGYQHYGLGNSVLDLYTALGPLNTSGNVFSANGANLFLDKTAGTICSYGAASKTDPTQPNKIIDASATVANFFPAHQNGSGGSTILAPVTSVDSSNYDDGSGTLVALPPNKYQIFRMYIAAPGLYVLEYGQNIHNSLAEAISAISTESHIVATGLQSSVFRSWIIVKSATGDLSNIADAQFVPVTKHSAGGGGGSGEINTASNVGVGTGEVFKQKTLSDLEVKTILQGPGILVVNNTNEVEISSNVSEFSAGNSGASKTIDWVNADVQTLTLTANTTLTFSNERAGGSYCIIITQDGTGSRTVTWPASVKWPGGTAPTLSTAASAIDIVCFVKSGSTFYGNVQLEFS